MYCVKKLGKDYPTDKNYYDMTTQRFVFNKYKTAKKYKEQVESVPESLQAVLKCYLAHHPLAKQKEFKLLVKPDGSPLNTVNSITRILNKVFGKKVGSSMLRHIYLSGKYGKVVEDMEKDAEAMGHSTGVQKEYVKF
jgi:integrase